MTPDVAYSGGMEVRIHRGATEIGGSCVEVRCDGATILLDLGRPLWAERGQHVPLPPAVGLGEPGAKPLALFISHGHQDHWGLVPDLPDGIPIWIGQGAADVLRAAEFWGTGIDLHEAGHLRDRAPIGVGPFTITPYLADHSAFDAYSLLVEAGGSRLLYSGDFRGHGRKHRAFDRLLTDPPGGVDVMLLEGTNLRAKHPDGGVAEPIASEDDVEAALADTISSTPGLVVVLSSAQNIDRLVTVYRATKKSDRNLAVDLYSAEVAAATGRNSIPQLGPDWPQVSTYVPLRQRVRVKDSEQFHHTQAVRASRIFEEDLAEAPGTWVLFGSFQSHIRRLLAEGLLGGGAVVWSMWDGYLANTGGKRLEKVLADAGVPLIHHHTSGHASVEDLARLAAAINPGTIVPIHTEAPERYAAALRRSITTRPDAEWWEV